jgi:glycosyltransferase involved in cell wall biosynthesis
MAKVLVISYDFPPTGGSKTRRLLKFLKYLPKFHWTPIVLTSKSRTPFGYDPSLMEMIPQETHVHRAFDLSSSLKRIFPFSHNGQSAVTATLERRPMERSSKTYLGRLCREVLSYIKRCTAIPDVFILWAPFAVAVGFKAIKREEVDVIYSTGPPFSNHIIGMCLKGLTKKPLILDFRDAWTANPVRRMKYPAVRHHIELFLEKIAIRNADLVISTTEGITQDFRRRYELGSTTKFITLPNGYDRDEFCLPVETKKEWRDKIRIVHTGILRLERSPKPLLLALQQLFDEHPTLEHSFEVYLIGENKPFIDGKKITDYISEFDLASVVKVIGHVPQQEALQYQMSADILLLVIGVVAPEDVLTYGIASKVFDYMVAGRPVLTLADPGPVSELVERTEIGPVFAPSDIDGIKQYLLAAVEAFKAGQLEIKSNKQEIDKYDFQKITGELVQRFHILTAN